MMQILLTRLQNSRTENFALRFVRFYHFVSARDDKGLGADFFIHITEQVQSGYVSPTSQQRPFTDFAHNRSIFTPLYLTVILPDTQKLLRPLDRKMAVISLTKTLANSPAFEERYQKGWAYTCEALLKLLENPPEPTGPDDVIDVQDVDDMSFGVGFTQLTTCRKVTRDVWPEVTDVKRWVGEFLRRRDEQTGGRIGKYVQERLSEQARAILVSYMRY